MKTSSDAQLEKASYTCSSCGREVREIRLKGLSLICPYCDRILEV